MACEKRDVSGCGFKCSGRLTESVGSRISSLAGSPL